MLYFTLLKPVIAMSRMNCMCAGRGHVHVIKCMHDRCSSDLYDGHRHALVNYSDNAGPGGGCPKDELTHEAYWRLNNFKDPCTSAQRQDFKMCGAVCGSLAHENEVDENGK